MNRFFVEKQYIGSKTIEIVRQDDIHHLCKVLRAGLGEELFISDGDGGSYIAVIESVSKASVSLEIKKKLTNKKRGEDGIIITIACAVPKNAHFEDIVDKCSQLGASEIIPLFTERTRIEKEKFEKKRDRLRRVIDAAAKQSGVLFLPELKDSTYFLDFLNKIPEYDLCLLPNLSIKSSNLKDAVKDFRGKKIAVLIGPEGDFTDKEIEAAIAAGCKSVSLGEAVFRVDTAAISVVGFLKLYFG